MFTTRSVRLKQLLVQKLTERVLEVFRTKFVSSHPRPALLGSPWMNFNCHSVMKLPLQICFIARTVFCNKVCSQPVLWRRSALAIKHFELDGRFICTEEPSPELTMRSPVVPPNVVCQRPRRKVGFRMKTETCASLVLQRPKSGDTRYKMGLETECNIRTTTSQKCEAVPRRARIWGSWTCVSLHSRLESNKEEETTLKRRISHENWFHLKQSI